MRKLLPQEIAALKKLKKLMDGYHSAAALGVGEIVLESLESIGMVAVAVAVEDGKERARTYAITEEGRRHV